MVYYVFDYHTVWLFDEDWRKTLYLSFFATEFHLCRLPWQEHMYKIIKHNLFKCFYIKIGKNIFELNWIIHLSSHTTLSPARAVYRDSRRQCSLYNLTLFTAAWWLVFFLPWQRNKFGSFSQRRASVKSLQKQGMEMEFK